MKLKKLLTFALSAMIIAPIGISAKTARADENLPQYLDTKEGTIEYPFMYQDKILGTHYYVGTDNYGKEDFSYFNKGVKSKIDGNYYIANIDENGSSNAVIFNEDNKKYYNFDMQQGKILGESNEYSDLLNQVYAYYNNDHRNEAYVSGLPNGWYSYRYYNKEGLITPNKKIIEYKNHIDKVTIDGDKAYLYDLEYSTGEFQNYEPGVYKITSVDSNGNLSSYTADFVQLYTDIKSLKIEGNKGKMILTRGDTAQIVDISLSNGKVVNDATTTIQNSSISLEVDHNNNLWKIDKGTVEKYENGVWNNKFQVNTSMEFISVYDDYNLFVNGYDSKDEKEIFTTINIPHNYDPAPAPAPAPAPGTLPTNSNIVVNPVSNNVLPITVNSVSKDAENVIDATSSTGFNDAEVTIADGKDLKGGSGSVTVKAGANTVIKLPFSAIDPSLLTDTSKVVLKASVLTSSDILKGIKGVKKVFEFDLNVVDGDKTTAVHNFANGSAEITITLSDDDLNGLNKNNLAVFYYNETTKQYEQMDTTLNGNAVTFKTPHFSQYVIAEKSSANSKLPQTGVMIDSTILEIAGVLFLLAGCAVLVLGKKKAVR